MSEDKIAPRVHVKITLKPEMQQGDNKWNCTINGEKRLVLMQNVEFLTQDIESAIAGIDQSELEEIVITAKYN